MTTAPQTTASPTNAVVAAGGCQGPWLGITRRGLPKKRPASKIGCQPTACLSFVSGGMTPGTQALRLLDELPMAAVIRKAGVDSRLGSSHPHLDDFCHAVDVLFRWWLLTAEITAAPADRPCDLVIQTPHAFPPADLSQPGNLL